LARPKHKPLPNEMVPKPKTQRGSLPLTLSAEALIRHVWSTVELVRKHEANVSMNEMDKRMGYHRKRKDGIHSAYVDRRWRDIRLSEVANLLHLMGKKLVVMVEDE
jgi:hypothetical protein